MPRLSKGKVPLLRQHSSGQWTVRLSGFDHYLGHDKEAAQTKYGELIGQWESRGRKPVFEAKPDGKTVADVAGLYLDHCRSYYVKRGKVTSQVKNIEQALAAMIDLYGSTQIDSFGPRDMINVINHWIESGIVRRSVNDRHRIIAQFFRWCGVWGYLPVDAWMRVKVVESQKEGRSKAPDLPEREPPRLEHVRAVQEIVCDRVSDMIELQMITGMRSCEICAMRPLDIDMTGEIWVYTVRPEYNKTTHKKKKRVVMLGCKCQEILKKYIAIRKPEQEVFRTQYNGPYTPPNYRGVIRFSCIKLGIPIWFPHLLRHHAATEIRAKYGLDAARAILGHSDVFTTMNYAKPSPDAELTKRVVKDREG